MRTIKFRGKYYHGEWLYGYLQKFSKRFNSRLCVCATSVTSWKDALMYQVLEETVGQFTGLRTKATPLNPEQKDIYEGDILRVPQTEFHIEYNGRVVFEYGRFLVRSLFSGTKWDLLNAIEDGAEIIGNAHDNPELLEKYMTIEIKQSER